jgi:cation diffusion facilitator family transporter
MPTRTSPSTRDSAIRRVLGGILIANLAVVLVKFGVGIQAHSLAVFGDAIQSAIDVGNNLFSLLVMGVASKAPDEEHPYGHAKFETLGALLIAVLLAISIFELVRGAVGRLITGAPPPEVTATGFVLLAATLIINVGVTVVERRAGERYRSELLLADALHTRVDVFITLTVMAGLLLARRGYPWADPVLAIVVAALVARAGFQIVRRTMPALVDERVYDEGTIRREAEGVPGVCSAYAIRSRGAPALRFAELTIAVDGAADVASAHRIADAVESRLREHLELHQIVVHVEPC